MDDNEIAALPYQDVSEITFLNDRDSLITFTEVFYERDIYEDSNPSTGTAFDYGDCENSNEILSVSLSGNPVYEIYITIGPGTSSNATIVDQRFSDFGTFWEFNTFFLLNNVEVNGIIYEEVFQFSRGSTGNQILLVPDIGIISIQFFENDWKLES
ncbi:hypothetical protein [Nonlabens spongiae]|uniref:hypothetical protein n=1 Tax=Nonlabens spongiae TaxID=331648 RepID=UPI0012F4DE48|nr:hypothetical protein [Nonlabens spongiae]